jgi:hypothetical protein
MTAARSRRSVQGCATYTVPSADQGYINPVEARALRQFLADLPDPREVALALPGWAVEALANATVGESGPRLSDPDRIRDLRPFGLVEYGGPYLTNFGAAVRRAIMEG